jgi:hypothetical protein
VRACVQVRGQVSRMFVRIAADAGMALWWSATLEERDSWIAGRPARSHGVRGPSWERPGRQELARVLRRREGLQKATNTSL